MLEWSSRGEKISGHEKKNIWSVRPTQECCDKAGKLPTSVRWVDTDKEVESQIRCRLVAPDFKGEDKDRDDLFAESPPLAVKRVLMSRSATRRRDGR